MSSFCKSYSHFFQQKISMYLPYFKTEILTSHKLMTLLSFEQLGPEHLTISLQFDKWEGWPDKVHVSNKKYHFFLTTPQIHKYCEKEKLLLRSNYSSFPQ